MVSVVPIVFGLLIGPLTQEGIAGLGLGLLWAAGPEEDDDSFTERLRVVTGRYPYDSGPLSSSASERWRLKLVRARDEIAPPSHQSRARNPPAFPEAAQAMEDFSIIVTAAPFFDKK